MRLKDEVAIITGAGSGQGKAAAEIFSEEGAKVVIAEWNQDTGKKVEKKIKNNGNEATFIKTDVSDEDSVKNMVKGTIDKYGKIDILFNNAGIGYSAKDKYTMDNLLNTPLDDWNSIMQINLNGTYLVSKYVLPHMIKNEKGSIVNNSSMNALVGESGADAYTAAKGGIVSLTRVMAKDFAQYNIRVNCICPGAIETPMIAPVLENEAVREEFEKCPLGRVGQPEEIAYTALFLASQEASYITGTVLPVDGGWGAI
ncbi:MAG: SDR family NAD(P)-dependent oxidoreductase [Candidatus Woesearchaeota archaeon]